MKSIKMKRKVATDHPMHKIFEAANELVARTVTAYNNANVPVPDSFALPIWVGGDEVMKITIEVGSKTTAEYAIFKAKHKDEQ